MSPSGRPAGRAARRRPSATCRVLLLWALVCAPLLAWGLPDSDRDALLFGGEPAWPAERYAIQADLEARRARAAGADTDLDPLPAADDLRLLTPDDAARAEILLRYRLFSRQPDEHITFLALQRMDPRRLDLDPRLYQYGGAYIYLVGAAIGASSLLGLTHLTRDAGLYLTNPAAFGRFYIAARGLSLLAGALVLAAVARLAGRAGGRLAAWLAMLCVALSPVFITAITEAKPHLPSAAALLWATLAALDYRRSGHWRDALRLGLLGGLAFGLVLTGLAAALLWPVLLAARPGPVRRTALRHLLAAGAIALGVYAATNPYLIWNVLAGHAGPASNLANSLAMYAGQAARAGAGAVRVAELLLESTGPGLLTVAVVGAVVLFRRHGRAALLAAMPGLGFLLLAVLLAAGKPAEFARFLLVPVLLLCVAAAAALAALARVRPLGAIVITIVALGLMHTPAYVRTLVTDARGTHESRRRAGEYLAAHSGPEDTFGVVQDPAPYAVPPLDFAHRDVWRIPSARPPALRVTALPRWLVHTADDETAAAGAWWQAYYRLEARFPGPGVAPARIAWADKPTFIYRRTP